MTPLLPLCIVLAYALAWGLARRVGDLAEMAGRFERSNECR